MLFGRFGKKEKMLENESFVGRHQQVLMVRSILGIEQSTGMEIRLAENEDLGERNEVLEPLEQLEVYMESDFFTTRFDVADASRKVGEIICRGYDTCVLPNDLELERRCLSIQENAIEYSKKLTSREKSLSPGIIATLDDIIDYYVLSGFLTYITLGGLLKSGEERLAWTILSSLNCTGKVGGALNKSELISEVLVTSASSADAEQCAEWYRSMSSRLLENGTINAAQNRQVETLIEKGLAKNQAVREQQ